MRVKINGSFDKLNKLISDKAAYVKHFDYDKYGQEGVKALSEATPKDTGLTANSWSYVIKKEKNTISIQFINSNIQNGVPIAIILEYGHATKNGVWIQGREYISDAVKPVFDKMLKDIKKEVG